MGRAVLKATRDALREITVPADNGSDTGKAFLAAFEFMKPGEADWEKLQTAMKKYQPWHELDRWFALADAGLDQITGLKKWLMMMWKRQLFAQSHMAPTLVAFESSAFCEVVQSSNNVS